MTVLAISTSVEQSSFQTSPSCVQHCELLLDFTGRKPWEVHDAQAVAAAAAAAPSSSQVPSKDADEDETETEEVDKEVSLGSQCVSRLGDMACQRHTSVTSLHVAL